MLALAGDDHAAASSSLAHQSEPAFIAAGMPVLAPTSLADLLELVRLPESIRGYGHVKEASIERASQRRVGLWRQLDAMQAPLARLQSRPHAVSAGERP